MRYLSRLLVLVPLVMAMPYACSDTPAEEEALPSGYEDVIYQGDVTDEALVALVAALDQKAPADVPSQAPTLTAPAADAVLPKTPITAFTWSTGPITQWTPSAPLPSYLLGKPAPKTASFTSPLWELIGPERSAHAHGTPYTGTATWVVFSTPTNPKLTRVLTSTNLYTPDQAVWDKLVAVGAPITVTLIGATFAENRIAMDGGPYKGSVTTFTFAP